MLLTCFFIISLTLAVPLFTAPSSFLISLSIAVDLAAASLNLALASTAIAFLSGFNWSDFSFLLYSIIFCFKTLWSKAISCFIDSTFN